MIGRLPTGGLGPSGPAGGRDLRRFVAGVGFVVGVVLLIQGLTRFTSGSASPVAAGTLVLALGLAAAVCFGIAANSSLGVLVWLVAASAQTITGGSPPLGELAFLALAGGWFISVVTHRRPLRAFGLTEGLMILFILLILGSAIAPHALPADSDVTTRTLLLNGVFFPFAAFIIARQTMTERPAVKSFLWFLVWFGLYTNLTVILYKLGPHALVFPQSILDQSVGINPERGRALMVNSAADGLILVAAFVSAIYLGTRPGVRFRRFALFAALTMPLGIYFTATRSIWLSAGLSVLLGVMFARGYRRWYVIVLLGIVTVIGVNWQTFLSADREAGGVTSVSEIDSRLNDIATAMWGIREEPVFGWGISRFPELNTVHHQSWGDIDWNLGYGYIGHNTPLVWGAELGLVGLALWGLVLLAVAATTVRAFRLLPRDGLLSKGFVLSFWCVGLGWLLTAAVLDMRLFPMVNGVVFVWAGMAAGLGDRLARGEGIDEEPEVAGRALPPGGIREELART